MDRAPSTEAVSRIVRWAIMLFIAYAIITGAWRVTPDKPSPPPHPVQGNMMAQKAQEKDKDCDAKNNPLWNFAQTAMLIAPTFVPTMRIEEIKAGKGEPAACGQQARLRYQYSLPNGTVIFSNLKDQEPTEAIIGDATLLHGVEMGMIGLKPGGEHKITFPPALGFDRVKNISRLRNADKFTAKWNEFKNSIITGDVALLSLSPPIPASAMPLRVIDRQISRGQRVQCGDTVRADMTLWKLDGTKLFSTEDAGEPLIFTIGLSQAPYGVEQAIIGMGEDTLRTAIIPAAYTQPLIKDMARDTTPRLLASDITWPEETLLMEVHLQHIGGDSAFYTPAPALSAHKAKSDTSKDDDDDDTTEKK